MSELYSSIAAHDLDRLAKALSASEASHEMLAHGRGWGPLHDVIDRLEDGASTDALVMLIRAGVDVEQGRNEDGTGLTPLLMAVFRRNREAVRILLAAGASPIAWDGGESALRTAVIDSDLQMTGLLLRSGADVVIDEAGFPSDRTPLGEAAARLDVPMVDLLLRYGAQTAARDLDDVTAKEHMPERTSQNSAQWDAIFSRLS